MTVVSNASPLIALARIGHLDILKNLYGEILIADAVRHEVVVEGAGQPGADEVDAVAWIRPQAVTNDSLVRALEQELGAGEAETIALGLEAGAELILMDERLGRETADHLGLRYTGVLGILSEAKHTGIITAIRPCLDALRQEADFRLSDELCDHVLRRAGELD